MKKTFYEIKNSAFGRDMCVAVVSDLHGGAIDAPLLALREESPDYILMPGDIFEVLDGTADEKYKNGLVLLTEAAKIAPTFYSTGNHEDGATRSWSMKWRKTVKKRDYNAKCISEIKNSGAIFLDDSYVTVNGIAFGGLLTGLIFEERKPKIQWLDEFCKLDEPKILLCHHPEYYEKYLRDRPIDLIVSGHAHGGQWRFFGRGVFAPGQGLFPKYTYGVHDNRFIISTGLKISHIPRFFNPPEVVFIRIKA